MSMDRSREWKRSGEACPIYNLVDQGAEIGID